MPRHGRKRKWYHWIIRIGSDQESDVNGNGLEEARRARDEAQSRYRQLTDKGGAVNKISLEAAHLGRRNHFAETLEQILKQGADRRAHGQ